MDSMDTKTVATTPDSVLDPISSYINTRSEAIKKKHGDFDRFIKENLEHTLPKIFFFMIPVMAAILKLLFIRRKDAYFVDHAIFSLHYHSFWFSLFLFSIIPMSAKVQSILMPVLLLIAAIYLVLSMKRVYRIGTFRSIANMFIISILYTIGIILAFTGDFLLIMCTA